MVSLTVEFYAFLLTLLMGMAAGFFFDLERIWRRLARPRRLTLKLADAAIVLLAGAGITLGLFYTSWGELRLHLLLGLAAGAAAYFYLASPAVTLLIEACLRAGIYLGLRAWSAGRLIYGGLQRRVAPPVTRAAVPLRRLARYAGWLRRYLSRNVLTLWKKLPGFFA